MNKKYIVLALVILAIVGSIYYFESMKIDIPDEVETSEDSIAPLKDGIYPLAPELTGISGYLNVEPGLKIADFRGKVVLIDFWTYTCINCIRTLPFLTEWHEKYQGRGLVIIGVHTPEFEFEKEYDNVKNAIEEHRIFYPVVQDNDYATWRAYQNRYWPHKY